MYLGIDTSEFDNIHLVLFDKDSVLNKKVEAKNRDVLKTIDIFLSENRLSKKDVQGIAVVVGDGSFTSTRLAVTVANTFSYTQGIPVLPVSKDQLTEPRVLIERIDDQPKGQYISAEYSGEPNIGK